MSDEKAFNPTPSVARVETVMIGIAPVAPQSAGAIGYLVGPDGDVPAALGLGRAALEAAGFDGAAGSALVVPNADGPTNVAVGIGRDAPDAAAVRNAAAAFARACAKQAALTVDLDDLVSGAPDVAAQAVVEGVLLARYSYDPLRREPKGTDLSELTLVADAAHHEALRSGAERGKALAAATQLARDLANTPHSHLNATRLAEVAVAIGAERGLEVEVFGKDALVEMGCGGLLGVNQGSAEEPRMIKVTYRPSSGEPTGRLALVGKGIMYDSGGIALKPGDEVHAQMKNDMSGAAAILAAMAELADLGCPAQVTGWLMCTDNMPSGTALALGDVVTMRGGTTVEVINTDAEGRLVMADALVLATEEPNDAIVDIATLTGSVHARPRHAGRRRDRQRPEPHRPGPRRRRGHRRTGVAAAPRQALPQRARLHGRRPEEPRRGQRRSDHRRLVPGRVRRRRALGAHRHRRHRPSQCRRRLADGGMYGVRCPLARRVGSPLHRTVNVEG